MSTGSPAPVVYVVDDDEALRDSLRFLLESAGYRAVTYASGEHFLDCSQPLPGACLVLDLRMPGISGIELQAELARRGSRLPIIFLTGHGDVPMAVGAVKRGAFDFIEKPVEDGRLLGAIAEALKTEATALAALAQRHGALARLATLTPREREVLDCVVAGNPNKRIAEELGISIKTVEAHRSRVMQKMQAGSTAELVQRVIVSRRAG